MQRYLSRRKKGSKNRHKFRQKIASTHARITNMRRDSLHKLTSYLTEKFAGIVIEDLNVKGMLSNRSSAKVFDFVENFCRRNYLMPLLTLVFMSCDGNLSININTKVIICWLLIGGFRLLKLVPTVVIRKNN